MKLRLILLVLSLLAIMSTVTGGFFYYDSLKQATFSEAERESRIRLETVKRSMTSFLSENIKPVRVLAGMEELGLALQNPNMENLVAAELVLKHFRNSLQVDVCYLMDITGTTTVSTNNNLPNSFVGKNFSFRPYFKEAISGTPSTYMALGVTSKKRGGYYSYPIFDKVKKETIGVVVIKASVELAENEFSLKQGEIIVISNPDGIVFITNKKDWLYRSLSPLSAVRQNEIILSRQFGNGPWEKIEFDKHDYLIQETNLNNFPGWKIVLLRDVNVLYQSVSYPLMAVSGKVILTLSILIGLSVLFLYRRASVVIKMRKQAEDSLCVSENRYRMLYNKTPAMLHSIDSTSSILNVSDYWLESLGYSRDEVLGRKITDFYTEKSRHYAEQVVIPRFFKEGVCKDISHQFRRKDGSVIDVLLSAIGMLDEKGRLSHSLAVSVDITQKKEAEQLLVKAKEDLKRYSQELEKQVEDRTAEIQKARDQLRSLSVKILNSQEQERALIARELHDELGQILTALRMDSVWLLKRLPDKDKEAGKRAVEMRELIDRSIDDVRGLAFRLRPGLLDDFGLKEALEIYIAEFARRCEASIKFKCEYLPELNSVVATAAYRIIQEALTNVSRYSEADEVVVSVVARSAKLVFSVSDNGKGFIAEQFNDSGGLGLAGMRERATLAGGVLQVKSRLGKGTTISFEVENIGLNND